ncbi:hypothetical protein J0910_07800 [Nocardiopsis sp. CNT-189]|uniref:hypothetical protein n=1 Tax=Nocardiopsis oceanisediminis TaxID=2816862 RepID=UPI003B35FC0D
MAERDKPNVSTHNELSGSARDVMQVGEYNEHHHYPDLPRPEPVWDIHAESYGEFVNHDGARARAAALYSEKALGSRPRPALLHVLGPAGVGKTAFGAEVALLLRDLAREEGAGEVTGLYADLAGVRAAAGSAEELVHVSDVLGDFLRRLHMPAEAVPDGLAARREAFHAITGNRRTVVVLEGVTGLNEVRPFETGPGSMLIATGRTAIKGLVRRQVPCIRLPALAEEPALRLLRGFDSGDGRVHRLLREDPEGARALVARCGGLPLALRIAGARLARDPGLDVAGMLHRLDTAPRLPEELDRLDEAEGEGPRVAEVIAFGRRGLSARAAELYTALGECPGNRVPAGLASALLGSAEEARAALAELTDSSLLAWDGTGHRWEPLIRHDARARVQALPDADRRRLKGQVLSWYAAALAHADRVVAGARSRVTAEHGDGAADRVPGGYRAPFDPVPAAAREWAGGAAEAVPGLMRTALDLERGADALLLAESLWPVLHELRRDSLAAEVYRRALEDAVGPDDRAAAARMGNYRGRALLDGGAADEAGEAIAAAAAAAEASGDPRVLAPVLETRGLLNERTGRVGEAIGDVERAREIQRGLGNVRGEALYGYQLAALHLAAGDPGAAAAESERVASAVRREIGRLEGAESPEAAGRRNDWRSIGVRNATRLGRALLAGGDAEGAFARAGEALESLGADDAPVRWADAFAVRAEAAHALGDRAEAGECADRALRVYRDHHLHGRAEALCRALGI